MNNNELEKLNYSMLEFKPGKIFLEGKRFLLINADAQGTLRRDLIANLGMERTKGFLLRHGWECGVLDAEDKKLQHPNISDYLLIKRGEELHRFEGMVDVEIINFDLNMNNRQFYVESVWRDSYEVEQHIKYLGKSNEPICWTLLGYAGGYATALLGKEIYYKEVSCRAQGDERCFSIGKTLEEWGDEILPELHYYKETKIAEELDVAYNQIQRQNNLLLQTTSLHDQLNQMVLSGKDRKTIIEKVGSLLNHPIIVEDVNLTLLEYWIPQNAVHSVKGCSLETYIHESDELREIVKRIGEEKRALDWPRSEDIYHTIVPIMIGDELLGYISAIHANNEESEFVRMIAGRTAGAIALDFSKNKIKLETEHRLKGELLDELLDPVKPLEPIMKRALFMGYDFEKKHQPIIWDIDPKVKQRLDQNKFQEIRHQLFNIVNSVFQSYHASLLIVERQQGVLSIIFHDEKLQITKIVEEINSILKNKLKGITVSICIGEESHSIRQLRDVFYEAKKVLQLLTNNGRSGEIFNIKEIRIFDLLYAGSSQNQLISFSKNLLKGLMDYDKTNNAELTWTLYTFLSNDGHLQKTADSLNLSVSGLKYRIQRIKEMGEGDWEQADDRFNLLLSLKVLRTNGLIVDKNA